MNEDIKGALGTEILERLEYLGTLQPESKEYQEICESICKLYRIGLESDRIAFDWNNLVDRQELERQQAERDEKLKRDQMAEQKKDRYVKIGLGAAEIIVPMIFYGVWMRRGFKFEESGTFTSTTFRGLFSKFKPTKK